MKTSKIENNFFNVTNFFEKPSLAKAKQYISKNYLWNAGIFVMRSNVYLDFILTDKSFNNNLNLCWQNKSIDQTFFRPNSKFFPKLKKISFDYYFVEKLKSPENPIIASMLDCEWSDLGSWDSIKKK